MEVRFLSFLRQQPKSRYGLRDAFAEFNLRQNSGYPGEMIMADLS
jgi:hypothetical protein